MSVLPSGHSDPQWLMQVNSRKQSVTNSTKQTMIRDGVVPKLTNFAQASLKPGEKVEFHQHATKYEVFHCTAGSGAVRIETGHSEEIIDFIPGTPVVIYPTESHSIENLEKGADLRFIYFGIAE